MPSSSNIVNWANIGANGNYTIGTGTEARGVTIETTTNAAGETAAVSTQGTPAQEALWADDLHDAVTTTLTFDAPVQNLSFELFDVDQDGALTDERVTILATDASGNVYPVSFTELDGLHTGTDGVLDADDQGAATTDTSGADDSVTVTIAGPITELQIIFDHGEGADQTGTLGVGDIAFENAPDGIVEGDGTNNIIDADYIEDPDGDVVTQGDDVIHAGDGNDTVKGLDGNDSILGGDGNDSLIGDQGNDTIDGGAGADTIIGGIGDDSITGGQGDDSVEAGEGNDSFSGGAGDDYVNGDYGDDVLHGGTGDDYLRGSFGNDTIHSGGTGEGDDFLWGGYGDDRFVISDGFGNDTIAAENQQETLGDTLDLSGVTTDLRIDLTNGASGIGTFTDGTDTTTYTSIEHIELSGGTDTLVLSDGSGTDVVRGFEVPTDNGDGTFAAGDMLDVTGLTSDSGGTAITTRDIAVSANADGHAVLSFPGGENLTLEGVDPADLTPTALEAMGVPAAPDGYFTGTDGDDVILIGDVDADGDVIDGGDAALPGTSGDDDVILSGAGNDQVFGGAGNDSIEAGADNDTVYASIGDDTLSGGSGDDKLFGEDGNDYLMGGEGADTLDGGADRDRFAGLTAGDVVRGGETGDDFDTLSLAGLGNHNVVANPFDAEAGTIELLNDAGDVTGTITYEGIENIVPCFTPGTEIATDQGLVEVQDLKVGDRVFTRDHGTQEIKWVGQRTLAGDELAVSSYLQPILITAGALGNDLPSRDMLVSPNHRMLINDPSVHLLLGESEILVAAKHLVGNPGISRAKVDQVTYCHFMFESHEIVWSDGVWSESFQPGAQALAGLDHAQRTEVFTLFPELESAPSTVFPTARPVAQKHEAALLLKG